MKEDSRPWEVDPDTLDTLGEWSYEGPAAEPDRYGASASGSRDGELHFFGYEAGGLATRDVAYCVADKNGELVKEEWFQVPYCALMHDFVVTREHVIFPGFPIVAELERLRAGGAHWAWDASKESFFGIMPRDGGVDQMRWFRTGPCSVFHFINGYTEGNKVHVDACVSDVPAFAFIREAGGLHIQPQDMHGNLLRWIF